MARIDPWTGQGASPPRGSGAERPIHIPLRGWLAILRRVAREIPADRLDIVAGSVAFFALLSLFPGLIALVSIYGLVADPAIVEQQMSTFYTVLPRDVADIIRGQLSDIVSSTGSELTVGFALSLAVAFWTASSGVATLLEGIGIAYDTPETRSFVRRRLMALELTLGAILLAAVLLTGIVVVPSLVRALGLGSAGQTLVAYGRWPVLALLFMGALSVLYRRGPDRPRPQWRWVAWGATVATLLWLAGSALLSLYVSSFADFNETYGTLGAVVVLLLWLFVSAFVVLLGAELNAEIERQVAEQPGAAAPVHDRTAGARAAVSRSAAAPSVEPAGFRRAEDRLGYGSERGRGSGAMRNNDETMAEAMARVTDAGKNLVADRLDLLRLDATRWAKQSATSAAALGVAGLFGLFTWILLMAAIALWLLPVWQGGAVFALLAGINAAVAGGALFVKHRASKVAEQPAESEDRVIHGWPRMGEEGHAHHA